MSAIALNTGIASYLPQASASPGDEVSNGQRIAKRNSRSLLLLQIANRGDHCLHLLFVQRLGDGGMLWIGG